MKRLTLSLCLGMSTASAGLAQGTLADWASVVDVDPSGGIVQTGLYFDRLRVVTLFGHAYLEKYGMPTAIFSKDGKTFTPHHTALDRMDAAFGGDGIVYPPSEQIDFWWKDPDRTTIELDLENASWDNVIDIDIPPIPLEYAEDYRPDVISLEDVAELDGPIDLFADEDGGGISLLDGLWISQLGDISINGCPPGVGEAAATRIAAGWSAQVSFSDPWHPSDLSDELAQFSWRPVGFNGYFSDIFNLGEAAQGAGMDLSVVTAVSARSPDRVAVWSRITLLLNPFLAAAAGGSVECTALVQGAYVRQ